MKRKVLLDTNLADNVDESFALALAACSPELELVGATVLEPKAELLTRQLLGAYGRTDVPVASSSHSPGTMNVTWYKHLASDVYQGPLAPAAAADVTEFMAEAIEKAGQITLVGTAPLTNIAAVLRRYPRLEDNIQEIVFMGGWSSQALPEWNTSGDPEAVAAVFKSKAPITAVGYEVTLGCAVQRRQLIPLQSRKERGPRLLLSLSDAWLRATANEVIVMHDPLPVALLCHPPLVHTSPIRLDIATSPGPGRGALYWSPTGKPINLCTMVDSVEYLRLLLSRVALLADSETLTETYPANWYVQVRGAYEASYYPGWSLTGQNRHQGLVLLLDGQCSASIDGQEYTGEAGTVFHLPAGRPYSMTTGQGMSVIWLLFDLYETQNSLPPSLMETIPGLAACIPPGSNSSLLQLLARQVAERWPIPRENEALLCKANFLELLYRLMTISHMEQIHGQSDTEVALLQAKWHIEAHFHKDITLDDLSKQVGLSKYHLARSFKEEYGLTPQEYQLSLRMQQAKKLLQLNHLTIAEIASLVGYSSVNAFSRAFRREFGIAPSEYAAELFSEPE
ncbi:MAG: helix-turn-helix domain-containing protein [Firmicutes bacterium]|nr:helix-turn-helix domain-containing protein [Bacillota bacterium]